MRALHLTQIGEPPAFVELDPPPAADGEVVVEIDAVALNPVDISIASGRFYAGPPPLPYVPGVEAVGRVLDGGIMPAGTRVYVQGGGIGVVRDGTLAERIRVPGSVLSALPDDVPDALACALGTAGLAGWIPTTWRLPVHPGDRVLVLGATSTAGLVAIQAAVGRGAARVVGVGRRPAGLERAREVGAAATIELGAVEDLAAAIVEAFDGERPTYVFDALWGAPITAALEASAPGVRVVHMGQSAGAEATIPSNFVRGRQAEIVGYSNGAVPIEAQREEYGRLLEAAVAGSVRIELETVPFDQAVEAWTRQAAGPGTKLVVTR